MASLSAEAARALKRGPRGPLARRPDAALPFLGDVARAGAPLLLDTCTYIDQMQGKAPPALEDLISIRTTNHSTVAAQELLHAVGALDPADPRTRRAVATIARVLDAVPPHRLFVPDRAVLCEAAICAGILCRTQGLARDNRMAALHDCVLFLQAMKLGFTVVTRNIGDFDHLLQMRPEGRVLFYRVPGR